MDRIDQALGQLRFFLGWSTAFVLVFAYYLFIPWPFGGLITLVRRLVYEATCPRGIVALCAVDAGAELLWSSLAATIVTLAVLQLLSRAVRYGRHSRQGA